MYACNINLQEDLWYKKTEERREEICVFCEYAWLNSSIYSICWDLTNYELGYGQYVYNGNGGVEGALNYVCV